jgi:hypothetical protein
MLAAAGRIPPLEKWADGYRQRASLESLKALW